MRRRSRSFGSLDSRHGRGFLWEDGIRRYSYREHVPRRLWHCFSNHPDRYADTLYRFCSQENCTDGQYPYGGLAQAVDTNLYGTTTLGGTGSCTSGCGTVFQITPRGTLATLYDFCSQSECGQHPFAGRVEATDGNLYGAAGYGGTLDLGTLFEITPGGAATTLYSFCSEPRCADGYYPLAPLLQATDGNLYGTTYEGDAPRSWGTVFRLDVGLGPFVSFVRGAGRIGQSFAILGQGLIGSASVSLNGTPAPFIVVSDTSIKVTIPADATTGYATVTTPTGVLTSNVPFQIIP